MSRVASSAGSPVGTTDGGALTDGAVETAELAGSDGPAAGKPRGTNRTAETAIAATPATVDPRVSEVGALHWQDAHLDDGGAFLRVHEAKTTAGRRDIRLHPVVRDALAQERAEHQIGVDGLHSGPCDVLIHPCRPRHVVPDAP